MNVSEEIKKAAESEAQAVIEEMERKRDLVRAKYKNVRGLDHPGGIELKKLLVEGMEQIAAIRKKYGIESICGEQKNDL